MGISRVEDTHFPKNRSIRIKDKLIDLSLPKIMGIINLTSDSFYENSRIADKKSLLKTVELMLAEGADFIDLGGFSTRPGAVEISTEAEINQVVPAIAAIKKEFPDCILSLDTFRGKVAEAGIEQGADIINDISGWQFDASLIDVVAKYKTPYILMHAGNSFETMHQPTKSESVFNELIRYFSEKIIQLKERGIYDVIVDPGFGFSKSIEQNYELFNKLALFTILERPILVGLSRKSMIYKKLNTTPEDALNGTTILNTQALHYGASILRVHDVKEAKQIVQLLY
jgi:dihydropteroate synthase